MAVAPGLGGPTGNTAQIALILRDCGRAASTAPPSHGDRLEGQARAPRRQPPPRNSRELAHAFLRTIRRTPRLYNSRTAFFDNAFPTPAPPEQILRAMTQRGYPLWLLRDWTAFFAFLIAFWTFVFAGFRAGRKAARGQRLSDLELQTLFQLLANAESRLDHAIWRQAWRACGYSAKYAAFVQMPAPTNAQELEARFLAYKRALCEMEQLVVAYADELRRRFSIPRRAVGDPNAARPLRHAPHATSTSLRLEEESTCARRNRRSLSSLNAQHDGLSRRSAAKAEGSSRSSALVAQARAPPPYSQLPIPHCLARDRAARTPAIVRTRTHHISATRSTRTPHYACAICGTRC